MAISAEQARLEHLARTVARELADGKPLAEIELEALDDLHTLVSVELARRFKEEKDTGPDNLDLF